MYNMFELYLRTAYVMLMHSVFALCSCTVYLSCAYIQRVVRMYSIFELCLFTAYLSYASVQCLCFHTEYLNCVYVQYI